MSTIIIHKVVSQLPAELAPNAIYLVRVADGFSLYATNASGEIQAFPLNGVLPSGGAVGDVLRKTGAGDFAAHWEPDPQDGSDKTYRHVQGVASAFWEVSHGLAKFPAVSVIDSGGSLIEGDIDYLDENTVTLTFASPFSGEAHFN